MRTEVLKEAVTAILRGLALDVEVPRLTAVSGVQNRL